MTLIELETILGNNVVLDANQLEMTYSEAYEIVVVEHQKHQSLYGETPDYQLILNNAALLIQQGSGHFLVLVSLCNAITALYKISGMIAACTFLNTYLCRNWETLYPGIERVKGRAQMVEWLIERFVHYFEAHPIHGLSLDCIDKLLAVFQPLQQTLSHRFNDALSLHALIRPLEEARHRMMQEANSRAAKRKIEQEKQEREAQAAAVRAQQNMMQTLEANAGAVSSDEYLDSMDISELHMLASKRLMNEKLEMLKNNLFCYAIYKHNRAEMWWHSPWSSSELLNLIDQQGLDWQKYSEAQKLKAGQYYMEALLAFEALSHAHPFYLPLQLHICNCLEELGAEQVLIDLLKAECKVLWQQYPELEDAKINNEFAVLDRQVRNYFDLCKPVQENNL